MRVSALHLLPLNKLTTGAKYYSQAVRGNITNGISSHKQEVPMALLQASTISCFLGEELYIFQYKILYNFRKGDVPITEELERKKRFGCCV